MADYCTPKSSTSELSSVFMTPSSSVGRPVYRKPTVLTPLPLPSFLSPAPSPIMSSSAQSQVNLEHMDILFELHHNGFPVLVDCILSLLSPPDLHSCLQVSHEWHNIISKKPHYMKLIHSHFKAAKENLKKPSLPLGSSLTVRTALSSLSNALPPSSALSNSNSTSSYTAERTQRHRPCPNCGSRARELNLRRAVCTNSSCELDFCLNCFRRWHEGVCKGDQEDIKSPKRTRNTLIAGSNKSKKRLRRL